MTHEDLNPQYLGIEEFKEKRYAQVSVAVDGKDILLLIDEDTGYPRVMRYKKFDPQEGQEVGVEEQYSDWTTNDGVAYAYTEVSFNDGEKTSEASYEMHEVNNEE